MEAPEIIALATPSEQQAFREEVEAMSQNYGVDIAKTGLKNFDPLPASFHGQNVPDRLLRIAVNLGLVKRRTKKPD